jgi:hypothetical protein
MLKEKQFFSEEKNQKTFITLGQGRCPRQRPWPSIKSLLLLFLQKKKAFPDA